MTVVKGIVLGFFKKNKELLDSVYITNSSNHSLSYAIILKEDNIENRTKIYSFLDTYELMNVSENSSIYFQFYPKKLETKLLNFKQVHFK